MQENHLKLLPPAADVAGVGVVQSSGGAAEEGPSVLARHINAYVIERVAGGKFTGKTVRETRYRLAGFSRCFGERPISQLTERAVRRWMSTISDRSTATRAAYLSTVRQFCRWLHKGKVIKADPCLDIDPIPRPQRVPRALAEGQVARCLDACGDDRDRAIIWLAVGCGLRRAEIARLRWSDYNVRAMTLFIVGKGAKERVVPVPSNMAAVLARVQSSVDGPIIRRVGRYHGDPGTPMTPGYIGDIVARVCRVAGVKVAAWDGVGTHSFRHTCASDVLDKSGDLRDVSQMLGHAGLPSTAIYLRIAHLDQVRDAMEGRDYTAA